MFWPQLQFVSMRPSVMRTGVDLYSTLPISSYHILNERTLFPSAPLSWHTVLLQITSNIVAILLTHDGSPVISFLEPLYTTK